MIPIKLHDKEINFNARLLRTGYIYKIEVDINDTKIHFERDEEGEWRALFSEEQMNQHKEIKKEVLIAIAEYIDYITK